MLSSTGVHFVIESATNDIGYGNGANVFLPFAHSVAINMVQDNNDSCGKGMNDAESADSGQ